MTSARWDMRSSSHTSACGSATESASNHRQSATGDENATDVSAPLFLQHRSDAGINLARLRPKTSRGDESVHRYEFRSS